MLYPSIKMARDALAKDWAWQNFSIPELACRCGGRFCDGEYYHDTEFLSALEALRKSAGRALIINSGHRCAQWNAAVGGAPRSMHKSIAVDISLIAQDRHALLAQARGLGFNGIGMARSFLHLDRRAVPAHWFYKGAKSLWQTS